MTGMRHSFPNSSFVCLAVHTIAGGGRASSPASKGRKSPSSAAWISGAIAGASSGLPQSRPGFGLHRARKPGSRLYPAGQTAAVVRSFTPNGQRRLLFLPGAPAAPQLSQPGRARGWNPAFGSHR